MSHKRTEIRAAIKDALVDKTEAGSNVFASRERPFFQMPYPAINIVTGDEENRPDGFIDHHLARAVEVSVDAYVEASDESDVDDKLDSIANEIETCLNNRSAFGQSVADATLIRSSPAVDPSGDTLIGRIRLVYRVTYMASA